MKELCRLDNVKKSYRLGETIYPLDGVSLSINSGDFICIQGPSGVGKSTLLYVIGSLLKAEEGEIYYRGEPISKKTDDELTEIRGEFIGYIFQEITLIKALTVEENLKFISTIGGKKFAAEEKSKIKNLMDRLGISDYKDHLPQELSGGQRRRAMIASALIRNPELILADEPTNDLDDSWGMEVMKILEELSDEGKAIVFVTHNEKWAKCANKTLSLKDGKLSENQHEEKL